MCLQLHVLYWRGNQRRTVERTCTCDTEWLLCVIACYRYKPVAWGNRWLRWSRDLWIQYRMFAVGRVSFWLRLRVWKWLQKFSTGCSQLEESLSGWDYVFENCCKNSVQNVRSWKSHFWMRLRVWKLLQKFSTECSQLEESLPGCDYMFENGCKNSVQNVRSWRSPFLDATTCWKMVAKIWHPRFRVIRTNWLCSAEPLRI